MYRIRRRSEGLGLRLMTTLDNKLALKQSKDSIPKPNCCSRRIPMNTRLSILAARWMTPACNHIHVKRRQPWCFSTTLSHSSDPNFSNLTKNHKHNSNLKIRFRINQKRESLYVREEGPKRGLPRRGSKESLPRKVATQRRLGPWECAGQLLTNIVTTKTATLATTNIGTSHDVHCGEASPPKSEYTSGGGPNPVRSPPLLPIPRWWGFADIRFSRSSSPMAITLSLSVI